MASEIFTVGHSACPLGELLSLLRAHAIEAVADVRSVPFSRRQPQFNADRFRQALDRGGIAYVPLGAQLGGRGHPRSARDEQGRIRYRELAASPEFRGGLLRLQAGASRMRIAIMCAEADPLRCHRGILISRELHAGGLRVRHLHGDGEVEEHPAAEARLLRLAGLGQPGLFLSGDEALAAAYERQEAKIAHVAASAAGS